MQQQINVKRSADRVLNDAASFFARRGAKVGERSERGLSFGLERAIGAEGGRVTVAPGREGTTVTVQANGIGVMALADSFARDLRKQARDSSRPGRGGATAAVRGGLAELRDRLAMPPAETAALADTGAQVSETPPSGGAPALGGPPPARSEDETAAQGAATALPPVHEGPPAAR